MKWDEGHRHWNIVLGYCWPRDVSEGRASALRDPRSSDDDNVDGWGNLIFSDCSGPQGNWNIGKRNWMGGATVFFEYLHMAQIQKDSH